MGIRCPACLALRICNSNISVTTQLTKLRLMVIGSCLEAIYIVLIRDFLQNFVALQRGFVVFSARRLTRMSTVVDSRPLLSDPEVLHPSRLICLGARGLASPGDAAGRGEHADA